MINWYNEVSRNLAKIPNCVAYFDLELIEAKKQCKIYGNLERASAALPGIVEERFSQLQQLEAILEYLNIELRRLSFFFILDSQASLLLADIYDFIIAIYYGC